MCPFLAIIPENTLPYRQNRTHKRPGLRCWNAGIPGEDYMMVAYPATIPQYTRGYGPRSHTILSVTSISRPVSSPIPAQTQSLQFHERFSSTLSIGCSSASSDPHRAGYRDLIRHGKTMLRQDGKNPGRRSRPAFNIHGNTIECCSRWGELVQAGDILQSKFIGATDHAVNKEVL
jgi:hypothetical protein